MNKNEKFIITINRELGSGGRTVGRILADKLGVPYYDKALIQVLEQKYNLSVEEIEHLKAQSNSWWADFKRKMGFEKVIKAYVVEDGKEPELLTSEMIYKAEKEILLSIAHDESCVIAGRSGFSILKKEPNHLSILIQASMEHRIARVMSKQQGKTEEEAKKTIEEVDKMREEYIGNFADTSRYDTRNYDLVIKMDGKTEEEVVDLILKYIG